jgi:hypothetical protein
MQFCTQGFGLERDAGGGGGKYKYGKIRGTVK